MISARRVVVFAGTLGTNEILLRSREVTRTLPKLSDRLGHGYSGNGDFLGTIQNSSREVMAWEGPDVTSVMRFDGENRFTMAAPGFSYPVMAVLASLGQFDGRWLRWLGPFLWPFMGGILPWVFAKGFLSKPAWVKCPHAGDPSRMTNLFAIGRDNANGVIFLKHGKLDIRWDYARENRVLISAMMEAMNEVNRVYGGSFAPLVTWGMFKKILTVHSLGGCSLSDSPGTGVVSPDGEVHGYPGLFVEGPLSLREQPPHVFGVGDTGLDRDGVTARAGDFSNDAIGAFPARCRHNYGQKRDRAAAGMTTLRLAASPSLVKSRPAPKELADLKSWPWIALAGFQFWSARKSRSSRVTAPSRRPASRRC